jgi:hypothetical protein
MLAVRNPSAFLLPPSFFADTMTRPSVNFTDVRSLRKLRGSQRNPKKLRTAMTTTTRPTM